MDLPIWDWFFTEEKPNLMSEEELKDDIKMERYREFSNSARKEERSKFYSAAGIWITLFVIIFLLVYFNAINLTRYY